MSGSVQRQNAPKVAAIYVRVASDDRGTGLGVKRQEEDCRRLCIQHGFGPEVTRVYSDNNTSAYTGNRRPAYRQLLEDVKAGQVRFVAVWHLDRLHRLT